MYVIGLDIGTTSVCGICSDAESGEILQTVMRSNHAFIQGNDAWEKIQDANVLMEEVCEIAEELLTHWKPVGSIGVTGQMHGIVYLNGCGEPVSPLYTWQDGRGDQIYQDGKTYAEWLSEKTGYRLATGYGAVTHFYNMVNGLVPETAVTFCMIHDLAAMTLGGVKRPVLHPSDAASLGVYDLRLKQFDQEAIRKVGMDPAFFPEVKEGYPLVGKTADGIPVAVAIGDNQASVLGSVKDMENTVLLNVGTGSQISGVVSEIPKNCELDCRPLTDGLYLLAGSSLCGGRAYAILEKFLRETAMLVTGTQVESAYPAMNQAMSDFKPIHRLKVDTTFSGTRKDPDKRGEISNIGIDNLTMPHLCDGVMNGMVEELYELYLQMTPFLEKTPNKIVGSGNGIRRNAHLVRRFENTFGMSMRIPAHQEEAAFGASLFSMKASEIVSDMKEAQKLIQYCDAEKGYGNLCHEINSDI